MIETDRRQILVDELDFLPPDSVEFRNKWMELQALEEEE